MFLYEKEVSLQQKNQNIEINFYFNGFITTITFLYLIIIIFFHISLIFNLKIL